MSSKQKGKKKQNKTKQKPTCIKEGRLSLVNFF
jgi:hypothetical protein